MRQDMTWLVQDEVDSGTQELLPEERNISIDDTSIDDTWEQPKQMNSSRGDETLTIYKERDRPKGEGQ